MVLSLEQLAVLHHPTRMRQSPPSAVAVSLPEIALSCCQQCPCCMVRTTSTADRPSPVHSTIHSWDLTCLTSPNTIAQLWIGRTQIDIARTMCYQPGSLIPVDVGEFSMITEPEE